MDLQATIMIFESTILNRPIRTTLANTKIAKWRLYHSQLQKKNC